MRIRSIRPEFWSSEDVARLDWHHRLIFVGLWSYVDDNGVGRDDERLIIADLFPFEAALTESSLRVHGALKALQSGGQITRYSVHGRRFLHVTEFLRHQKINRPTTSRYPLPDNEFAIPHGALSEDSVSPHVNAPPGEGEKGRRGEGVNPIDHFEIDADTEPDGFNAWWDAYDHKVGRRKAEVAYRAALKRPGVNPALLLAKAAEYVGAIKADGKHPQYTKHPTTWLNGEHWRDERTRPQSRIAPHVELARRLAAEGGRP